MEENQNLEKEQVLWMQPQKKRKSWPIAVIAVIFVILGALVWLFYTGEFHLDIVLAGEGEMLLEYGDSWREPGAEAVLRGKWLPEKGFALENVQVQMQSDLQDDALGKYMITYIAQTPLWKASAQRQVRVVDTVCPVITLKPSNKTVLPGHPYEEDGYIAVDNYDGNLTDRVHRREEPGVVIYTVMDSSGNPASIEREIPYFDPLAPEILLEGGEKLVISCGTFYEEPGFTATDDVDGDLTEAVAVEGEVVWYQPGSYPIAYTVSDSFGNVTQKIRTVTVEGKPRPEEVWPHHRWQ